MAKDQKWQDDYWLLLMQLYLKKPVGINQMYSKAMVNLSMELHVAPQVLFNKMCEIANLQTPRIERIWQEYGKNPRRLSRAVSLLRQMKGFGNDNEFYQGVDIQETFERDFRPVNDATSVTPVMLILILDLYFRLTPITMVPETPEIQELGRLMKIPAREVADIMDIYQHCDPYLNRKEVIFSSLFPACQEIWQRYGNMDTEELSSYAQQLKAYFNS